jgi:hypothetical protein
MPSFQTRLHWALLFMPPCLTATALAQTADSVPAPRSAALTFPARQQYKHGYKIREMYDKFADRTTAEMPDFWWDVDGSEHMQSYTLTPRFSYRGQQLPASADSLLVQLVFETELKAHRDKRTGDLDRVMPFRDPEKRQLIFLLNGGERIDLGSGTHDEKTSQGLLTEDFSRTLEEKITYPVPVGDFLRIVNAQTVEARFGQKVFKLDKPKQREGLRDLASRMRTP